MSDDVTKRLFWIEFFLILNLLATCGLYTG